MIKKIFKILLWFLLITLLCVFALLAYATSSNSGLQKILQLGQKITPGELTWAQAEGRLLGPLHLQNLEYHQGDGLHIQLNAATLNWSPLQIFSRHLTIDKLQLQGLRVHLPKPLVTDANTNNTIMVLPNVDLPLAIDIQDLNLSDVSIYQYGSEEPILIQNLTLRANADGDSLQIEHFHAQSDPASASVQGMLQTADNYPMNMQIDWVYEHEKFGQFNGLAGLEGDLSQLKVSQTVKGPLTLDIQSELFDVLNDLKWNAKLLASADSLETFASELNNSSLQAQIQSQGSLEQFSTQGQVHSSLEQTGPFKLSFKSKGNIERLTIEQALIQLTEQTGEISLAGDVDIKEMALDAVAHWQSLSWPLDSKKPQISTPNGKVSFKGSAKSFVANLNAGLLSEHTGLINTQLDVKGNTDWVEIMRLNLERENSNLSLSAKGRFDIHQQKFEAQGEWHSLTWPLLGEPQISSPKGNFSANGRLSDYQLNLLADVEGEDIPKGQWQLTGSGSEEQFDQFKITGRLLGGELELAGHAAWSPEVEWDALLKIKDINPGQQWPEVPGNLNLTLKTNGEINQQDPQVDAIIKSLSGTILKQPVSGSGAVRLHGNEWVFDGLRLNSGKNRFFAGGRIGKQWNLKWTLNSPNLSTLAPDLAGIINGRGTLSGTSAQPKVNAKLAMQGITSGDIGLKHLTAVIDVDLSGKVKSKVAVNASGLDVMGQTWQTLQLTGKGTPVLHTLDLNLNSTIAKLSAGVKGGIKNQTWTGKLLKLSARETQLGDWMLKQSSSISANAKNAKADIICLNSDPSEICVKGNWSAAQGSKGHLTLKNLRPERFKSYLPEDILIDTALNGTVDARIGKGGKIRAKTKLELDPGSLTIGVAEDLHKFELAKGVINATVNDNSGDAELTIELPEIGIINSNATINNLFGTPSFKGKLTSEVQKLSFISSFLPDLQEVKGNINTDLQFSGTVEKPVVAGSLALLDFSAEVPQLAIKIEESYLTVKSNGDNPLIIDAASHSGKGQLALTGKLDPSSRSLTLAIDGENYEVANSDQIQAVISPHLQISMDNDGMKVGGELLIPTAKINTNESSGGIETTARSGDVVFIEEDGEIPPEKTPANMNLDINIILGDDIRIEAGDFKGALKGSLKIKQEPELAPRGTGTIEVVNGDYVIYGQQLKMQKGKILFSGGPVDNPQLDMDVARNVEAYDVIAGAKIRGTAQSPLLQLYSEPSMPDASILSFILLGQPPGSKGGSYTVGKYLTPDLYVSYGIGLFNAVNTFNMRYKLTDKFALQAASSTASSADIIYTLEK